MFDHLHRIPRSTHDAIAAFTFDHLQGTLQSTHAAIAGIHKTKYGMNATEIHFQIPTLEAVIGR